MTKKKMIIATLDIETSDGLKGEKFCYGSFYHKCNERNAKEKINTIKYDTDGNYKEKLIKKAQEKSKNRRIRTLEEREYIVFEEMNKFFEEVFKYAEKRKILCFIHNEDFDIRFIMKYCIDVLEINPVVLQTNSRIIEVIIQVDDYDITFRDSFQFLLCSLQKAEETYLNEKIKVEVNFTELLKMYHSENQERVLEAKKILKERVKSDTESLYKIMYRLRGLKLKRYGVDIFYTKTLPSMSIMSYKKYLRREFEINFAGINPYIEFKSRDLGYAWKNDNQKDLYYWTRKAYFGGRCEPYDLDYKQEVYYYDFNNLYASMCIMFDFPTPNKYYILEYPDIEILEEIRKKNYLYIVEATVNENQHIPILPYRCEDSVRFLNGEKTGVWCSPEFEEFLKYENNEIVEIQKIRIYTDKKPYFKKFMKEGYYNRLDFQEELKLAQADIEKLVMTSLTGKPAQKPIVENWVLFTEELQEKILFENQEQLQVIEFNEKYKLIKVKEERLKDYMICEFSAFITSYARTYLYQTIHKLFKEGFELYYTDTDCIFTNKPIELNNKLSYLVGKKEGQLKNELMKDYDYLEQEGIYIHKKTKEISEPLYFDEAKFYLPKVYVLKKGEDFQLRAKGISLFMIYETLGIELERNDETKQLLREKLSSFESIENLLFKSGVYMHRYLKYKSSLRRNSQLVSFAKIDKKIKKVYDKRYINSDMTTEPLNIKDIEDLKELRTKNLNILKSDVNMSYVNSIKN